MVVEGAHVEPASAQLLGPPEKTSPDPAASAVYGDVEILETVALHEKSADEAVVEFRHLDS